MLEGQGAVAKIGQIIELGHAGEYAPDERLEEASLQLAARSRDLERQRSQDRQVSLRFCP
jgi:hypothetical protein